MLWVSAPPRACRRQCVAPGGARHPAGPGFRPPRASRLGLLLRAMRVRWPITHKSRRAAALHLPARPLCAPGCHPWLRPLPWPRVRALTSRITLPVLPKQARPLSSPAQNLGHTAPLRLVVFLFLPALGRAADHGFIAPTVSRPRCAPVHRTGGHHPHAARHLQITCPPTCTGLCMHRCHVHARPAHCTALP